MTDLERMAEEAVDGFVRGRVGGLTGPDAVRIGEVALGMLIGKALERLAVLEHPGELAEVYGAYTAKGLKDLLMVSMVTALHYGLEKKEGSE